MKEDRGGIFGLHEPLPKELRDPAAWLGGKGASLRKLAENGFRVPLGFTIATTVFREYASHRHLSQTFWDAVRSAVEDIEASTGKRYAQPEGGFLLAVRSGAAQSMPGMLRTVLNCGLHLNFVEALAADYWWQEYARFVIDLSAAQGLELPVADLNSDPATYCRRILDQYHQQTGDLFPQDKWKLLERSVLAVFESWDRPQARAFRKARGIDSTIGTAVTVQVMAQTSAAGVLFSHDPRSPCSQELLIEAVRGSGVKLVDGSVTPSRYLVSLRDWTVVESTTAIEDALDSPLDAARVVELARAAVAIERCFGHPVDVEWGYDAEGLIIFQTRPLLKPDTRSQRLSHQETRRVRRISQVRGSKLWVRHSLGDTLPHPTPLTWDVVRPWMSGRGAFGQLYQRLHYRPSAFVQRHGFLELIAGRIYADPAGVEELFRGQLPLAYDLKEVQSDPRILESGPTRIVPEKADPLFLLRMPLVLWRLWRSTRLLNQPPDDVVRTFESQTVPQLNEYLETERQINLQSLSDEELCDLLEYRRGQAMDRFGLELLWMSFLASAAFDSLNQVLHQVCHTTFADQLSRKLVAGLGLAERDDQEVQLYRLAAGEGTLDEFLERCGHRGPTEMELSMPRWRDAPDLVLSAANQITRVPSVDPRARRRDAEADRNAAEEELLRDLSQSGGRSLARGIQRHIRHAQAMLPYRELAKNHLMKGYELIRAAIQEIGRRSGLGAHIYFLRWRELKSVFADASRYSEKIERRRRRRLIEESVDVPETIAVDQLEEIGSPRAIEPGAQEMMGLGLSHGVATGVAYLALAGQYTHVPQDGRYVLICPTLDLSHASLLIRAAGLVVERGGILSHGAVVARQFGIPAVTLPDATRRITPGEVLEVDADRGIVTRKAAR